MANNSPKQEVTRLLAESQGNIANRFDSLDDTTPIVIFETPHELCVYRPTADSSDKNIIELRTITSGEAVPQIVASMNKGAFYTNRMLAVLLSTEMKKDRPIKYYGI